MEAVVVSEETEPISAAEEPSPWVERACPVSQRGGLGLFVGRVGSVGPTYLTDPCRQHSLLAKLLNQFHLGFSN